MSDLNKKYKEILKDIEDKIKDEKDLKYINEKMTELSVAFFEMINDITDKFESRIQDLEEQQVFVEGKLKKIQKVVDDIEGDIYDQEMDFEVICPYCNNEFTADITSDSQEDIKCPECHNVIELDWNEDCDDDCGCSTFCDADCECDDCGGDCGEGYNCENCNCGKDCDCDDDCDCGEDCDCDEDCDCGCNEHKHHDNEE